MRVFKFGGASVKDADAVRNVAHIVSKEHRSGKILMIVSAMGKTTNDLEEATWQLFHQPDGNGEEAVRLSLQFHLDICRGLFPSGHDLEALITKEWNDIPGLVEKHRQRGYDFVYDQVVSLGEWISTQIVAAHFQQMGIACEWTDAIDFVKTDETWREGRIDWARTREGSNNHLLPLFQQHDVIITQGFTGGTEEGFVTTLGREGSDYSAAIFSHCLDAESMTVWKDVPGILNADPKKFRNATLLDRISYREAIEMTYYGAKVIHPKTIQPLQSKNIPLYVKSFVEPEAPGTLISADGDEHYPPIVVLEPQQNLLHISTRDFSFVAEEHLGHLFSQFAQHRIKVNMMRNTAISFFVCVHHKSDRLETLIEELKKDFQVERTENLELITIRYYNDEIVKQLKRGKIVLLEERLRNTLQLVVKDVATLERISG